jgi:hypothetical protein
MGEEIMSKKVSKEKLLEKVEEVALKKYSRCD